MSGRRSAFARACVVACACAGGAACESDPTRISEGVQTPIVHAVLNPVSTAQFILLENTLGGRVDLPRVDDPDPDEPIRDAGGDPILDAYVVVYNSLGDSAIALERRTDPGGIYHQGGGGKGAGVYAFHNYRPTYAPHEPAPPPYFLRVVRGERYRLVVQAADGRRVTAATTVPNAISSTAIRYVTFNRDRDTLSLTLPPAQFAKRYGIHIQTPRGPFELFTEHLQYQLRGALRNTDHEDRPRAFMPGFEQVVSLSAVDTNYFDFFRSANDSVTGRGLLEHVDGGSGVFGSYAPLDRVVLRVTADINEPVEGRYIESGTGKIVTLYVNEHANGISELAGSYGLAGGSTTGVLGQLVNREISLVFLANQTLADTVSTFRGTWAPDSITGARNDGSPAVFRRAPSP